MTCQQSLSCFLARHTDMGIKSMDSKANPSWFQFLAVASQLWPWASFLMSSCLSVFIIKMEIISKYKLLFVWDRVFVSLLRLTMNSWTEMIFLPQLRLRIHIIMSGGLFLFVYLSGGNDWGGGFRSHAHWTIILSATAPFFLHELRVQSPVLSTLFFGCKSCRCCGLHYPEVTWH